MGIAPAAIQILDLGRACLIVGPLQSHHKDIVKVRVADDDGPTLLDMPLRSMAMLPTHGPGAIHGLSGGRAGGEG